MTKEIRIYKKLDVIESGAYTEAPRDNYSYHVIICEPENIDFEAARFTVSDKLHGSTRSLEETLTEARLYAKQLGEITGYEVFPIPVVKIEPYSVAAFNEVLKFLENAVLTRDAHATTVAAKRILHRFGRL